MKNRAQRMVIFILSLLFILCYSISYSQEWSSEEKEAFKIIQNVCDSWAKRDLETYMSFYHSNFVGWFQKDPLPIDKNSLHNWERYWLSTDIIHHYELKPVCIKITDDIAVSNVRKFELNQLISAHIGSFLNNAIKLGKSIDKVRLLLASDRIKYIIISL
jgi:hypothetical protein